MTDQMINPTLDLLLKRRSVKVIDMIGPGPTRQELDLILRAGHRVPDHGKIGPWRFVVIHGDARKQLGPVLRDAYLQEKPNASETDLDLESQRFERAPVVIAVIASPNIEHPKVPVFEQLLSVGAACQNMLVAAESLGLAAQWLTEWTATSDRLRDELGCEQDDQIAAFIYIGHKKEHPADRARPDFETIVSYYNRGS